MTMKRRGPGRPKMQKTIAFEQMNSKVRAKLEQDSRVVGEALLRLLAHQTQDERMTGHTAHLNDVGFSRYAGYDKKGTELALKYKDLGYLAGEDLALAREIALYHHRQLTRLALMKAAEKDHPLAKAWVEAQESAPTQRAAQTQDRVIKRQSKRGGAKPQAKTAAQGSAAVLAALAKVRSRQSSRFPEGPKTQRSRYC